MPAVTCDTVKCKEVVVANVYFALFLLVRPVTFLLQGTKCIAAASGPQCVPLCEDHVCRLGYECKVMKKIDTGVLTAACVAKNPCEGRSVGNECCNDVVQPLFEMVHKPVACSQTCQETTEGKKIKSFYQNL